MNPSFAQPNLPTPLLVTEKGARMAKADIRKTDTEAYYAQLGGCLDAVRCEFRLTLQQFAAELGKDERQLARQIEGKERPQLEVVFAVARFSGPLVIALARLAADVDVVTEIRVRRSA